MPKFSKSKLVIEVRFKKKNKKGSINDRIYFCLEIKKINKNNNFFHFFTNIFLNKTLLIIPSWSAQMVLSGI